MKSAIITRRPKHVWFDAVSPEGHAFRIKGDPNMNAETLTALGQAMDLLWKQWEKEQAAKNECGSDEAAA